MRKSLIAVILKMLIALPPVGAGASHRPVSEVYVWTPKGQVLASGKAEMMMVPEWVVKLIKAAVDQVLKAMNLALMRIQNKNIDLSNAAKVAESIIHSNGMKELMKVGNKMKDLYEKYYDELKRVKDAIVTLASIKDLLETEKRFVEDYAQILKMVNSNDVFKANEIKFITDASAQILTNARANIADVKMVIESFKTDMTDAERLLLVKNMNQRIDNDRVVMRDLKSKVENIIMIRRTPDANSIDIFFTN